MLKVDYFTAQAGPKATVAAGGMFTHVFAEWLCLRAPFLCDYIMWVPDKMALLMGMMLLDLLTGVVASRGEGQRINSRRLGEGAKRKFGMLTIVAGAILLEGFFHIHNVLPVQGLVYTGAVSWFIAVEFLSLYENVDRMGVRMPVFLKVMMEKLLQKSADAIEGAAGTQSQQESELRPTVAPVEPTK